MRAAAEGRLPERASPARGVRVPGPPALLPRGALAPAPALLAVAAAAALLATTTATLLAAQEGPEGAQAAADGARTEVETLILSPEPGERVGQADVLVAASFVDPGARLDPGSVVLRVDGRNVTPEAEVSGEVVSWVPGQPLPPGPHRVTLEAADRVGEPLTGSTWAFTVAPTAEGEAPAAAEQLRAGAGDDAPFWTRLQGSVTLEGQALSTTGPGADLRRDQGALPRLWLNAGGLLGGGWRYSARVHLSGYESSDRQPVNRYRVDLRSDWLRASLGDVSPAYHDLILAGRRVRGVEADLRAGPASLSVLWGESRRGIEGLVDPDDPTRVLRKGTYARDVFAVRPAVGGSTFQVGATFFRARDDVGSIPDLRNELDPVFGGGGELTGRVNVAPKDNVVAGTDATLRLFDGRVLLQYDNAVSLLANDISSGAVTESELDELMDAAGYDPLGVDPSRFEDVFIINSSMIPLDPRDLTSLAQQARASVRTGPNILSVEWRSVGGSYHSLGFPALRRDRRGVRIRDSFTAFDDALAVALGVERDEDNLDDVKPATTTHTAVYASASWQAAPRAPALTGSVRRRTRDNELPAGRSGALDEESVALSLGASYPVGTLYGMRTRLRANVSTIDRSDPANPLSETRDRYYLGGVEGESEDGGSRYSVLYGLNTTELLGFEGAETDFHRIAAEVRQRLRPRWTATLDGTLTAARSPDEAAELGLDYDRVEVLVGGEFEWTRSAFVTLSAGISDYGDARFPGRDTRELVTRLRLHQSF